MYTFSIQRHEDTAELVITNATSRQKTRLSLEHEDLYGLRSIIDVCLADIAKDETHTNPRSK